MIIKEKITWILGTALFIGFYLGKTIGNGIDYEPNTLERILLVILLYLCSMGLVVCIKWSDRSLIEHRLFTESQDQD